MAPPACASCSKSAPQVKLKHCARCPTTRYCSRDCQTAHWPVHRATCGSSQTATTPPSAAAAGGTFPSTSSSSSSSRNKKKKKNNNLSPPKGLQQGVADPFTRLENGTWLHDRPQTDVFALLIDAYRLRVEDMYTFEGEIETGSLYGGADSGLDGFRRFLAKVKKHRGASLLPPWWDAAKEKECLDLGMDASQWHDLRCAVEKSDIIEHYGDSKFPMQLRMFAEAVYGRGPGGSDGAGMRAVLMAMEKGSGPGLHSSLDMSSMFSRR